MQGWRPADGWLDGRDPLDDLATLLAAPTIANKRWVWEQYDHHVQTNTVTGPGADAAVLTIRGTDRGLALAVDGNGRWVYCDPRAGGALAVAEAARNLAAVGAKPLAVTDCLNFGNPEKDPIYYQFVEAIRGVAEACRALGTPVVSGNVSFYNESSAGAVHPTPTIGMVGLIDDLEARIHPDGAAAGDVLIEIGGGGSHLGASSFLKDVMGTVAGRPPEVDLEAEAAAGDAVRALAAAGIARAARDVSDGGLAVAAAELAFAHPPETGIEIALEDGADLFGALFGEDAARLLVAVSPDDLEAALGVASDHGVAVRVAGRLTDDGVFRVAGHGERPRAELEEAWRESIPRIMKKVDANR